MIEKHELLLHPDDKQKVWRYMDFTKFVDLLNSESLYFARIDMFDDIFEGSLTKKTVETREKQYKSMIENGKLNKMYTPEFVSGQYEKHKLDFALNCWHMNDHESAAMWKIYLKSNEGIAIQSSFKRLKVAINKSKYEVFAGAVEYIDYENDFIDYNNILSAFIHKRKSFSHENELRLIIWKYNLSQNRIADFKETGLKIKINLKDIVENIYVSPDSPKWLTELIEDTCKKFGFNFNVINSKINEKSIF